MTRKKTVNSINSRKKPWCFTKYIPGIFALLISNTCFSSELKTGDKLFSTHCSHCHELDVAPVIWGYPEELVKIKVRSSTGSMPRFPIADIDQQELDSIARYIKEHTLLKAPTSTQDPAKTSNENLNESSDIK